MICKKANDTICKLKLALYMEEKKSAELAQELYDATEGLKTTLETCEKMKREMQDDKAQVEAYRISLEQHKKKIEDLTA